MAVGAGLSIIYSPKELFALLSLQPITTWRPQVGCFPSLTDVADVGVILTPQLIIFPHGETCLDAAILKLVCTLEPPGELQKLLMPGFHPPRL